MFNPAMGDPDKRDLEWEAKEHLIPDTIEEMKLFEYWQKGQPTIKDGMYPPMEHLLEWDTLKDQIKAKELLKLGWVKGSRVECIVYYTLIGGKNTYIFAEFSKSEEFTRITFQGKVLSNIKTMTDLLDHKQWLQDNKETY